MRTRSPGLTSAFSVSACHAVNPTNGTLAASVNDIPWGANATVSSWVAKNGANAPSRSDWERKNTRSPGLKRVTSEPTWLTTPAPSLPGINGNSKDISARISPFKIF